MSRHYQTSEVSIERHDDRRHGRGRDYEDDRYEVDYRARGPPARDRSRDVQIREEVRTTRSPPEFLRDDYGRTSAGPMVLRARETEEFDFIPKPRRRSPSPEPDKRVEKEEIVIRKDEGPRRSRYEVDFERDDVMSRRGGERRAAPPRDFEREEIVIRREDRDDDREPRYARSSYDDYPARPKSHERERSSAGRGGGGESDEIIIRRDERNGRGGDREREIIIRRKESRSPSPTSSVHGPRELPTIRAPPIHQDIITHHRHIDHGYDIAPSVALAPRLRSRPPSPPTPPREEERIEIRRTGERNGRAYDEDIIIDRNERRTAPPRARSAIGAREAYDLGERGLGPRIRDDINVQEEADYYNNRALERGYPGEGYNGATRQWGVLDIPPGTSRVELDGVGGGRQEITWQRYNGLRRSKFIPDSSDEGYSSEISRPLAPASGGGEIGARYGPPRDERKGLWTEITKDLVVKEAITESGYEFEETDEFFYIIAYMQYEDVARLVGLSDDIKARRLRRAQEMDRENRFLTPVRIEEPPSRLLAIEGPAPSPVRRDRDNWDREEQIIREREIVYRGGPPPDRWRPVR